MNQEQLESKAKEIARDAHENHFSSHWGFDLIDTDDGDPEEAIGFYMFDNHPYANDPTRRLREHAELRAFAESIGCTFLAEASYPETGPESGYTVVLLFSTPEPLAAMDLARDRQSDMFAGRLRPVTA